VIAVSDAGTHSPLVRFDDLSAAEVDWTENERAARDHAMGDSPTLASKRSLVAVSHAIESAVLTAPINEPTVMVALFQRLAYFDRERAVYQRLAGLGVHVVIGFCDGQQHDVPESVHGVVYDADDPLADEWSVVALSPRAGAFLVATDQHQFDPRERSLEASRQFSGRWGYSHTQAAVELARMRLALGGQLDPEVLKTIDGLLTKSMSTGGRAAGWGGDPAEIWATTSLFHMTDRMQIARAGTPSLREQLADAHATVAARTSTPLDPESGLVTFDFLAHWSNTSDVTTLPVGLGLFEVAGMTSDPVRTDPSAAYHAARRVAAALQQPLGAFDTAVRFSRRHFLIVVPGASSRHLALVCDTICEHLRLASHGYPDVSLAASVATVVTSSRPLPLTDLQLALERNRDAGEGPFVAGETATGDRIVVASPATTPAVAGLLPQPGELEQPV
jgi:DICT domain-containing protein